MCLLNSKHQKSFKNAKIYEDPGRDLYTIKGKATDGTVVTLNFVEDEFCDGTVGETTLVCRLDIEGWDLAKEHAIANKLYFHVHGTATDTKHIVNASLSFFSSADAKI